MTNKHVFGENMGFMNKIFKEDKSKELFEENNLTGEWHTKSGDVILPDLHIMDYLRLTRDKTPKRKNITQEMIDEYKNNMEILDKNGILTNNLENFVSYWANYGVFKIRPGSGGHIFNEEYSNKAKKYYQDKIITQEIAEGYKIYLKNIDLLDENNLRDDVDIIFRIGNKYKTDMLMFLIENELDLTEKILCDDDLIKIMEYKIKLLLKDIDGYSRTSLSSSSSKEVKKMYMMKAKTEIDNYERNIRKLSNNKKPDPNNINSDSNTMYCRFCGNKIPTDSKFCNVCGEKL